MLRKTYRLRLNALFLVPLIGVAFLLPRLYYLQVVRGEHYRSKAEAQHHTEISIVPCRGKIFDTNGRELASSTLMDSVYVSPNNIDQRISADLAHDLSKVLGTEYETLLRRIRGKSNVPLKRKVDEQTVLAVKDVIHKYRQVTFEQKKKALDAQGIYFVQEGKRFYPRRGLASHIIGYTILEDHGDNKGQAGVELVYDDELRGSVESYRTRRNAVSGVMEPIDPNVLFSTFGNSTVLTVDETIQHATESALNRQVQAFSADCGVAVVYGVKTGEVLAMANCPSYDLTNLGNAPDFTRRNRAITDVIEPGSVMKIFTYASLIEEDKIRSLDEIVNCEGGRWTVAGRTVVDSHAIGSVPVRTAFSQSSNVGAAKLAVTRLTPQRFYRNLSAFGFGEQTGIDLPGESSGLLRPVKNWTAQSVASLAYGYELQCSAIQVAAAAAAIANNGIYMKPHVVKEIRNYRGEIVRQIAPQKVRRVCSPLTSQKMRALMEEVVLRGTGKSAQLEHYRAGGKTGTTIKIDPETGKYSRGNYIASFCGIAPLDDPQICVYVWIDNPKGSQYYGGQVSAPVFKEIAEAALEALKVPVRDNRPSPENVEVALERVRSRLQDEIPIDLLDPSRRDDNVSSGSMPDLTGLTMREAQDRLRTINVPIEYRGSGVVIDQMPKPYETIESGEPAVVTFGPEELYREKLARNFSKPASGLPEGVAPGYTIEPASLRLETQGKTAAVRLLDGKSAPSPSPGLSLPKPAMHATPAPTPVPDVDSRAASAPPRDGGKSTWAKALKEASKPNPETGGQRKGGDAAVSGLSPGPLKSLYDAPSPADSRNTESSQNDE